jgi:hypothetical protein
MYTYMYIYIHRYFRIYVLNAYIIHHIQKSFIQKIEVKEAEILKKNAEKEVHM